MRGNSPKTVTSWLKAGLFLRRDKPQLVEVAGRYRMVGSPCFPIDSCRDWPPPLFILGQGGDQRPDKLPASLDGQEFLQRRNCRVEPVFHGQIEESEADLAVARSGQAERLVERCQPFGRLHLVDPGEEAQPLDQA